MKLHLAVFLLSLTVLDLAVMSSAVSLRSVALGGAVNNVCPSESLSIEGIFDEYVVDRLLNMFLKGLRTIISKRLL